MNITASIILLRGQNHTNRIFGKVFQITPNLRRNKNAPIRTIHVNNFCDFTIINFYIETTGNREDDFSATHMSMTTTSLPLLNSINPKDPLHVEYKRSTFHET